MRNKPGRPRLFTQRRSVNLTLEASAHAALSGAMLRAYRKQHPRAKVLDVVRGILDAAIDDFRRQEAERSGVAERERAARRQQLRRLAVACAGAADNKVEVHARKLAALVAAEGPAA